MSEITDRLTAAFKNLATRDHGNPHVSDTLKLMIEAIRLLAVKVAELEKQWPTASANQSIWKNMDDRVRALERTLKI